MIALFHVPVSKGKDRVTNIHYKPERLTAEQKQNAILLPINESDMPVREDRFGKFAALYINPQTKELWYEYEDRPLTEVELLTEISQKLTELINLQKVR